MHQRSRLHHHRLVVGFHGCDRAVGEHVLLGRGQLKPSTNTYDWLGSGIYFWEHSEHRAWAWALDAHTRGEIREPFVLGAYINLGRCFDLTDTASTSQLSAFYQDYENSTAAAGRPLAENRVPSGSGGEVLTRHLDCAVLNFGLAGKDQSEDHGEAPFETVRGVFVEGPPAYKGAAIRTKTHIQICVRDPSCILGFFMPIGYPTDQEAR
jgi:hypothetical protein